MKINDKKYLKALEWLYDLEVTDKEEQYKKALFEYIETLEVFSSAIYDSNQNCIILR